MPCHTHTLTAPHHHSHMPVDTYRKRQGKRGQQQPPWPPLTVFTPSMMYRVWLTDTAVCADDDDGDDAPEADGNSPVLLGP